GAAGLIATGLLDLVRLALPDAAAYATVFSLEAALFIAAAFVALRILRAAPQSEPILQPGE
ncbi:MAG: PucC family protein, partial [Pseudomonadota bacterium]